MVTKGDATRNLILEHASQVAARDGLEALSIGKLAQDLSLSKSGLFAHFGSKEALQVAILEFETERFIAEVLKPALAAARGVPRLEALFDRYAAWALARQKTGGCLFMSASFELDDRPGPARDKLVATERDWLETLAHAVRIASKEGHFAADADPELAAQELHGIQMAAHHMVRLLGDDEAIPRARRAFTRWLDGYRNP